MARLEQLTHQAFLTNKAIKTMLTDSPSIYSPHSGYHGDTAASLELSSALYSPEAHMNVIRLRAPPTPGSLSRVSAIDGSRIQAEKIGPVNSTFIDGTRSCVTTLDLSEPCAKILDFECELDEDSERTDASGAENDITSSGYSSGYSRSKVNSEADISHRSKVTSEADVTTDSAVYDLYLLGDRPKCVGEEDTTNLRPRHRAKFSDISTMSIDSDTSVFMQAPLCRQSVTTNKSKASYKTIGRKLKQFRKQFQRHQNKPETCSQLKTLAVL